MSIPVSIDPLGTLGGSWTEAVFSESTWDFDELTPLGIPYAAINAQTPEEIFTGSHECLRDARLGVVMFSYMFRRTCIADEGGKFRGFQYNFWETYSPKPVPPRLDPPFGWYGALGTPAFEIWLKKPARLKVRFTMQNLGVCWATSDNWTTFFEVTPSSVGYKTYEIETSGKVKSLAINRSTGGNISDAWPTIQVL